jgi:hypothetical protein
MRAALRIVPATLLLVAASCAGPHESVHGPGPAAAALFELARGGEPADAELERRFEMRGDLDARAALLDALERLAVLRSVEIVAVEPAGPTDAFADFVGRLEGGGEARYSVRVRAGEDGAWKVVWFQGPGVEWPQQPSPHGERLSTSMPPEDVE